jgi:hypothetical protein
MTAFLTNLVRRAVGETPVVQPLPRSFFEPEVDLVAWSTGPLAGVPADVAVEPLATGDHNTLRASDSLLPSTGQELPSVAPLPTSANDVAAHARVELPLDGSEEARTIRQDLLGRPFQGTPTARRGRPGRLSPTMPGSPSEGASVPPVTTGDALPAQLSMESNAIRGGTASHIRREQRTGTGQPPSATRAEGMRQLQAQPMPSACAEQIATPSSDRRDEVPQTTLQRSAVPDTADPLMTSARDVLLASARRPPKITNDQPSLQLPRTTEPEGVLLPPARPGMLAPTGSQPQAETTPVVRVEIGRIEVRAAVTAATPTAARARPAVMTLEEYAQRKRSGL